VDDIKRHKKYSGYVVYVAYRLEPRSAPTHNMRLAAAAARHKPQLALEDDTVGAEDNGEGGDEESARGDSFNAVDALAGGTFDFGEDDAAVDREILPGRQHGIHMSLSLHAVDPSLTFGQAGSGALAGAEAADDEDERLLEELEDKQLLARIKELEAENSG